jgi:hypothetical protein
MQPSFTSFRICIVATWARSTIDGGQIVKISHVPFANSKAESVSYLVCARIGVDTASEEYLAGYVRKCSATPAISLDRVMKSVWLLEKMGRTRLGLR